MRAALDAPLSSAERVLYAALVPSVQTPGHTKIYVPHVRGRALSDNLRSGRGAAERGARGSGRFWKPSERGDKGGASEEEEDTWRADFEQELQVRSTTHVQEGSGADDPFRAFQLHIILDRTDAFLDEFASWIRDGAYDRKSAVSVFSRDCS